METNMTETFVLETTLLYFGYSLKSIYHPQSNQARDIRNICIYLCFKFSKNDFLNMSRNIGMSYAITIGGFNQIRERLKEDDCKKMVKMAENHLVKMHYMIDGIDAELIQV